jgi:hypothetical protein
MVKSTDFREGHYATFRRPLDASRRGRVFLEREMGSRPMIIRDVSSKHATQMPLVQNDDVVPDTRGAGIRSLAPRTDFAKGSMDL